MQRSELYKQTLLIEKCRLLILLMLIALNHIHYNTCKTATFVFKKKQNIIILFQLKSSFKYIRNYKEMHNVHEEMVKIPKSAKQSVKKNEKWNIY